MMRRIALLLAVRAACSREPAPAPEQVAVGGAMSEPADPRFARALEPREFAFPADHGPHEDFQTEWWYFTGNLDDAEGRELAYELTFFRRALAFEKPEVESDWAARDVYMAHLAVGEASSGTFHAYERFARGALELAGARAEPWRVWLRDWSASGDLDGGEVHLVAREGEVALDLHVRRIKPIVLQGERGFSRKGREHGSASFYYSIPRLETRGTLVVGGRTHQVRGESWFDREWSTSALEPGQVGWDWFALRFDDGTELMLYRIRRDDGSFEATSSGSFVDREGRATQIANGEFELEVLAHWTSPETGREYPSRWRVRVPKLGLASEFAPTVPNSELDLTVRYWEGPVRGEHVRGFVELTGY